ncbi:LysE family translocator [Thermodesulforhabdus norvegica]|uniref:Threonine/homoserine/homoserine lactone efflux protein n=1 Tax=Thermodesulforhabdus norvegica TaxID=39841 RepID=A0A1I4V9R6_9BACT|nr:LysE family transporter [Thermodesulforhabdus norvegica]SFM97922.1 Threonine/homoserine/homoserine lactone efflux protein [Thermodesulforhabdus norvegica]
MIATGILLGLGAGLSPGPLLALVVSETLRYGPRSGMKTALAPLITDLPIVALSFLILTRVASSGKVLGILSMLGAVVVMSMGIQTFLKPLPAEGKNNNSDLSLLKGAVVNFLNPHPYLFWFTVGGPLLMTALRSSRGAAVGFVLAFYVCLVGSKVLLALCVHGTKGLFLKGRFYEAFVRLLGLSLCVFAGLLFWEGINLFQRV